MKNLSCTFCQREFTNPGAKGRHVTHCHSNPNYIKAERSPNAGQRKGSIPWNKGKIFVPKKKIGTHGGHRHGSGRGQKGWIRNIFCDSSWELAYVLYCTDHNVDIKRNTEKFAYEYQGKIRNYIPDFIVNGSLVEVKGYKTQQWESKKQVLPSITVLDKDGIKPYLKYAQDTYGKDFIKLYFTEGC